MNDVQRALKVIHLFLRGLCWHIQVCAIKYSQRGEKQEVIQVIPVAGSFPSRSLDAKTKLLTPDDSKDVTGVIIELHGGHYRDQQQYSVIELSCDRTVEVIYLLLRPWVLNRRLESRLFDRLMKACYDSIGEQNMPVLRRLINQILLPMTIRINLQILNIGDSWPG